MIGERKNEQCKYMRKYGEALWERRGLSQYQLGALVGVSDKAVSKWENGASKPRTDTIRKLSEVLDVSIDELLTCKYDAFNKTGKDLYAMRNEIKKIAENKMKELYGDYPPIIIENRFRTEMMMLDEQETFLWIGFFGELQKIFLQNDLYFEVRGAHIGASFVAWLLGGTCVNTLHAHYYCPVCKKIEFSSGEKCEIDLPEKTCSCGNLFKKDGFGIDAVNMLSFGRWNEIYVSKNGTEYALKCLQEYFNDFGEIREIRITNDESAMDFYDDMSLLTVLENPREQVRLENLFDCDDSINLQKVFDDIENPRFIDLLSLHGILGGTGVWEKNGELLYDEGIALDEMITCREDVYDYLYKKISDKGCENPVGLVYEIKENVRKGKYSYNRMPSEIEKLLLDCDVPEWYVESMKKIRYLFPKTHMIAVVKRKILTNS